MSLLLQIILFALATIIMTVIIVMLSAVALDTKVARKAIYLYIALYGISIFVFGYRVYTEKKIEDNNSDKIKITITGYATEEEFNNIKNNHVLENISEYIDDISIDMER